MLTVRKISNSERKKTSATTKEARVVAAITQCVDRCWINHKALGRAEGQMLCMDIGLLGISTLTTWGGVV